MRYAYILVGNRFGCLAHKLFDLVDAAHLGVDLLENIAALLQAEYDVLLNLGELDVARQLLELLELSVGLGQQRLLVLLAAQSQQRPLLIAVGQALPRDFRLLLGQNLDAPLVLVELVALCLQVEDRPIVAKESRTTY